LAGPSRGEVWLCDLNPTCGHEQAGHQRTCLVVSANGFNQGTSGLVIICPVTKVNRNIPFHVPVSTQESKLNFDSVIECDQVRSISVERLKNKVGVQLPGHIMVKVEERLKPLLNIR
jgi:mRNA interferase MazF